MSRSHQCPGPNCAQVVSNRQLACSKHWFTVSGAEKFLQEQVAKYGTRLSRSRAQAQAAEVAS